MCFVSATQLRAASDVADYADDLDEVAAEEKADNPFSVLENVMQEFLGASEAPMMKMLRDVQQTISWLKKWVYYCVRQVAKVLPEPFKSLALKVIPKMQKKAARAM